MDCPLSPDGPFIGPVEIRGKKNKKYIFRRTVRFEANAFRGRSKSERQSG